MRPARLIEEAPLACRAVGPPVSWPDPVAFLDGVQRLQLLAYAGSAPLLLGEVAAAVREKQRHLELPDAEPVLLRQRERVMIPVLLEHGGLAVAQPHQVVAQLADFGHGLTHSGKRGAALGVERARRAQKLLQALLQVQGYFIWHGHT